VRVDVLNGFGGAGAASETAQRLRAAGWQVGSTGDAGTGATRTTVVFAPGKRTQALVVARRLQLGTPRPISGVPGVPPGSTSGVAILLGPDLVPGLA
jgi:hypothetical protein